MKKIIKFFSEWTTAKKIKNSGFFDEAFYLKQNPDVESANVDPLLHFIRYGAKEGRSPSAMFDLPRYLSDNPRVDPLTVNPLLDWLDLCVTGQREAPKPIAHVNHEIERNSRILDIYKTIRASGLFDDDYYTTSYPEIIHSPVIFSGKQIDCLLHYIIFGHEENKNPSCEFDTYFYKTQNKNFFTENDGLAAALMHYIQHGRALGLASRPNFSVTLSALNDPNYSSNSRVAVQAHLFYTEFVEDLVAYLEKQIFKFDLYISTTTEANSSFIKNYVNRRLPKQTVIVRVVANRGRDIAPFVDFLALAQDRYDYVCHVHSKKSPHATFGQGWFSWLMTNLFGAPGTVSECVKFMDEHPVCAVLFPDTYSEVKKFATWGGNEERISAILSRFGLCNVTLPRFAQFPAGSMGWYRTKAFIALRNVPFCVDDFEAESGQEEGTLAHVLERALPMIASTAGYEVIRFYRPIAFPALRLDYSYTRVPTPDPIGRRWLRDTPAISVNRAMSLRPLAQCFNPVALEISWIIPDFGLGAGGHMTIFRIVQLLEQFGHRQTIWIQNAYSYSDPETAKTVIRQHYRTIGDRVAVRFLPDNVLQLSGDVLIATDCWTVFPARAAVNFKERFYFIQDFEPSFHPVGDNFLIAEATYRWKFAALCAGEWLRKKAVDYGMWARRWDLASDPEFYYPGVGGLNPDKIGQAKPTFRIAFYCRSYTPRRAVGLGMTAFAELSRRRNDFEIVLFGEDPRERDFSFPFQDLGILSPSKLGELYRQCDLGVAFSATNFSLVPLEMMACGLPVLEIDTESTRTAYPEGTVAFAEGDPLEIADAIESLLANAEWRSNLTEKALDFVSTFSWEVSAKSIESALIERLLDKGYKQINPRAIASPPYHLYRKSSIIIPTYNGGELFQSVLRRVAGQECDFGYDILVIDSSSTDGTAEFAAKFGGSVRCHVIPKNEFQHGRTRNLAISLTDGDFVGVLTQDALPADNRWLENLINAFEVDPLSAGVFGRHAAYAHHSPLIARDINNIFNRFAELGPVFNLDRGLPNFMPRGGVDWRMAMQFYSDNNSAMRRSVWKVLPYPEIEWGEDQVWAWEALKLGFSKVYSDAALVFHSHRASASEQFKIGVAEGEMFSLYFGYDFYHSASIEDDDKWIDRVRICASSNGISEIAINDYVEIVRASIEGRKIGSRRVQESLFHIDLPRRIF